MAYSKQTWNVNSDFTPTRMNHIEEGIENIKYITAYTISPNTNETWASLLQRVGAAASALSSKLNFCRLMFAPESSTNGSVFQCGRVYSSATTSTWYNVRPTSTGVIIYAVSITSESATLRKYSFTTSGMTLEDLSSAAAGDVRVQRLDV